MNLKISEISDARVASLVQQINETGVAVLSDVVAQTDLARARAFVATAIGNANGYVAFAGPDSVTGSGLDDLSGSPAFVNLMRRLYEKGTGREAPAQELYQVLRCLTGKTVTQHSYYFHYDSYVITALIPIEVPASGQSGDLLIWPNVRRIRSKYIWNAVDKVMLDNAVTQLFLKMSTKLGLLPIRRVKIKPGNLYFFWGYRSVHTNEPCDADKVRATALFHYANPHRWSN